MTVDRKASAFSHNSQAVSGFGSKIVTESRELESKLDAFVKQHSELTERLQNQAKALQSAEVQVRFI